MRVGLFVTCLVDALYLEVGRATVTLLKRLGCTVEFPPTQTCCGQVHVDNGYPAQALPLVRRHGNAFEDYEFVVAPSRSCVASARHQHAMVARRAGHEALAARAAELGARTFELSQFLVDVLGVVDIAASYPHHGSYHPTCHSLRLLRVGDRPVQLLRAVAGPPLTELAEPESCCGFGGTFAVRNPNISAAMKAGKVEDVARTGATVPSVGDSSCLMHLRGGLIRRADTTKAVHLAEILASTGAAAGAPFWAYRRWPRPGSECCTGSSRVLTRPAMRLPIPSCAPISGTPPPRFGQSGSLSYRSYPIGSSCGRTAKRSRRPP